MSIGIWHVFGNTDQGTPMLPIKVPMAQQDVHPPAEMTSEEVTLVSCKWYGDSSTFLEVWGYNEQAAIRAWLKFRAAVRFERVEPRPADAGRPPEGSRTGEA